MWNLSLLLCLFPALTHTLLERQWAPLPTRGPGELCSRLWSRCRWWSLFPLGLAVPVLTDTSTHHSIALQGTHSAGQDKTRGSFSGPALVVPVNLPCAAVMRVHGYSLVEELSQCFLMNTQWPKAVLSEGVISQTGRGNPAAPPPPPPRVWGF